MVDKMLTPEEVAMRLSVTPNTVRGWLREGSLKGIKLGKRIWRIKETDLHNYFCYEQTLEYGVAETTGTNHKSDKRKALMETLKKESRQVRDESILVLKEFEGIDDEY
jgi:excisionase family DNA binding protein